jgi:predicted RNase H-like HicB family nuclease
VSRYTAVVKQDGGWWLGWVEEVPGVNAQEPAREALLASLKEVLQEALEMNRAEARAAAGGSYEELAAACCEKAATTPGGTNPRADSKSRYGLVSGWRRAIASSALMSCILLAGPLGSSRIQQSATGSWLRCAASP